MRASRFGRPAHWFPLVLLATGIVFGISQCHDSSVSLHEVPAVRLSSPSGAYFGGVWLHAGWLVRSFQPGSDLSDPRTRLWLLRPDGSDMHVLELPTDEQRCRLTAFFQPRALWDGRLAYIRQCYWYVPKGLSDQDTRIAAWDPTKGVTVDLRNYDVPGFGFGLSPDLAKGIASEDTGIEDHLFWLEADGARRVNMPFARADSPAWSPDGQWIAFLGNQKLRGEPGPSWAAQPVGLWIMPAACESDPAGCAGSVKLVVSGIYNETGISWSPDGLWIVFTGTVQLRKQGVWLWELATGRLIRVAVGDFHFPAWSPDGKRLSVVGPPEGRQTIDLQTQESALYVLDVSGIVGK